MSPWHRIRNSITRRAESTRWGRWWEERPAPFLHPCAAARARSPWPRSAYPLAHVGTSQPTSRARSARGTHFKSTMLRAATRPSVCNRYTYTPEATRRPWASVPSQLTSCCPAGIDATLTSARTIRPDMS